MPEARRQDDNQKAQNMTTEKTGSAYTTFAVRKELKEPLMAVLARMGLKTPGDLLAMVAQRGDEVVAALAPIAAAYVPVKEASTKRRGKGRVGKAIDPVRVTLDTASDDELAAVLAKLRITGNPP